nr:hypothetical protein [Tanacetum cinerariifolium]
MRTRSSSNLPSESSPNPTSSNPKHCNHRRSKQPFILEESLVYTMADQRTIAELLCAPIEGYAEAIVLEKEPPRSILTWEDLVSKFNNEFFPPSRTTNLRNEISNFQQRFDESFHEAWDRYKDLLRACPHHGFTELHQLDTFYNALNPGDQDSLNSAASGNLLERRTQDVLTIIENKSKIAKLTHAVNQQTSDVTTTMTVILKQFQATPPPASVKAIEEICVTCGGAHPYYQCLAADGNTFLELQDNIQGYVSVVAVNYNQGNFGYRPPGVANQIRPSSFAQPNVQNNQNRFSQPQGYNQGNNFNQDQSYQTPTHQNQVVPLRDQLIQKGYILRILHELFGDVHVGSALVGFYDMENENKVFVEMLERNMVSGLLNEYFQAGNLLMVERLFSIWEIMMSRRILWFHRTREWMIW